MQIVPHAGQAREREFTFGLGQCRLCSCWAFKGRGNICEDCGHHYDDHTTKPFRSTVVSPNHSAVAAEKSNNRGMSR
jgi:hypothetical protein